MSNELEVKTEVEGNDKVSKQFEKNIKYLFSIFNGPKAFKKQKIKNDEVGIVVEELIKERKEGLIKDFKDKASKLLDRYVEYNKFIAEEKKKLEQADTNKKKEFNKELEECFKFVEDIQGLEKKYSDSFKALAEEDKNVIPPVKE